jgi:secreted trypsin-like serine protease
MTAGHCGSLTGSLSAGAVPSPTAYPPEAYEVTLGSVYADGHGGETHAVSEAQISSDYFVTNGGGNDVTLMKLDKPTAIAPMHIAAAGERGIWKPGVLGTIAGFGLTSQDAEEAPDQMQVAQVPITTDEYCAQAYPDGLGGNGFDPATMVCAGYPEGGTDTCEGDSGGPLLAPIDGTYRLVGATSFGDGCAQKDKPGVYARVAEGPIRDWIRSVVPDAFAPEPKPAVAKKPAAKKKAAAKRKRCTKRRGRAQTRRERARMRACRRAQRRR